MKKKGFTTIELIVGLVLAALLVVLIGTFGRRPFSALQTLMQKGDLESDLLLLAEDINRTGRAAGTSDTSITGCVICRVVGTPAECTILGSLMCRVDLSVPPSGTAGLVPVQFSYDAGNQTVTHAKWVAGAYVNQLVYRNISSFDLCSDQDMAAGGTCAIDPPGSTYNATYTTTVAPATPWASAPFRLFRYRIGGARTVTGGQVYQTFIQSAFYVRNPSPYPSLVYQYGTLD